MLGQIQQLAGLPPCPFVRFIITFIYSISNTNEDREGCIVTI